MKASDLDNYHILFENINTAAVVADKETGVIVDVNQKARRLWGKPHEDFVGEHLSSLHPEEVLPDVMRHKESFGNNLSLKFEIDILASGGKRIPTEVTALAMKFDERDCIMALYKDLKEKEDLRQAVRESEEKYQWLVENINDIIYTMTPEGVITYVSPGIKAYGYSSDELLGKHFSEVTYSDDHELANQIFSEMFEGSLHSREFRVIDSEGKPVWVTTVFLPEIVEGRVVSVSGRLADCTDFKILEKELRSSRDLAEASSKAMATFLANMSHEIRTPLNGIMGMLQLLKMGGMDPEKEEYVELALNAGQGLQSVIDDVLDFSKISAGKITLVHEEFRPRPVVETVTRSLAQMAVENNVEINLRYTGALPEKLMGDEARIRQVLFNIVGNAVKFTRNGKIEVDVKMLNSPAGEWNSLLLFCISDNGPGIPDSQLSSVLEPYTQVKRKFKSSRKGTGLGLSISAKLVKLMGGSMSLESEEGKGTTICFTVGVGPVQPRSTLPGHEAMSEKPAWTRKLKILVVDDDVLSRDLVYSFFSSQRHEVSSCEDGEQAVNVYQEACKSGRPFEAVILDVDMPGLDGVETVGRLRKIDGHEQVPMILLSAHVLPHEQESYLSTGADAFLPKPVTLSQLNATLRRVSERKQD